MKECSICTHSQLENINQELVNGVSVRKIAEKYGISHMAVQRHKTKHIVTSPTDIKCNDKNSPATLNRYTQPISLHPTVTTSQALGGHWKVGEEDGKVILYFKERIIPLEPYGKHYFDPQSKEEFKKDGESWYLRIPYYKGEWVNLDNVGCFYE